MEEIVDSRHLRVFVTVVREGSLRKAAKRLHLTPSAVSHALKAFENTLGSVLFERTTRSLVLTEEGGRMLQQAEPLLEGLENLCSSARRRTDPRQGRLRIGASPTACQYLVPGVIREFKDSCPHVSIQIRQASAAVIAEELAAGRIDLGISPRSPDHRGLHSVELASDELAFIVHPMHAWARTGKVNRSKIGNQRFILAESRSLTKQLIDDYLRRENLVIQPFIEIGNEEVIKELVRLDIGVGILPRWIAAEEIDKGMLVALSLGRKPPVREWVIAHRNNRKLTFPENLFVGISRLVAMNRIGVMGGGNS